MTDLRLKKKPAAIRKPAGTKDPGKAKKADAPKKPAKKTAAPPKKKAQMAGDQFKKAKTPAPPKSAGATKPPKPQSRVKGRTLGKAKGAKGPGKATNPLAKKSLDSLSQAAKGGDLKAIAEMGRRLAQGAKSAKFDQKTYDALVNIWPFKNSSGKVRDAVASALAKSPALVMRALSEMPGMKGSSLAGRANIVGLALRQMKQPKLWPGAVAALSAMAQHGAGKELGMMAAVALAVASPAIPESAIQPLLTVASTPKGNKSLSWVLSSVAAANKNPKVAAKAAKWMLENNKLSDLGSRDRAAIMRAAVQSKDPDLKRLALSKLPASPISNKQLEAAGKKYIKLLQGAVKKAKKGSLLHQMGELMAAMSLTKDPKYKSRIDTAKLNRKFAQLMKNPRLQKQLAALKTKASASVIQTQWGQSPAKTLEKHLRGEEFQQRLKLLSPTDQKKLISGELRKLMSMDRTAGLRTAKHLLNRNVLENRLNILKNLPPAKREAAIKKALIKAGVTVDKVTGLAGAISSTIGNLDEAAAAGNAPRKLMAALTKARANPKMAAALKTLQGLDKKGILGSVVTMATLFGMGTAGLPKNLQDATALTANSLKALSLSNDVAKLLGFTEEAMAAGKFLKLGKALKAMKFLGPVADALTAGLDFYGALKELEDGDTVGAVSKFVSAGSGVAGVAAGIAIAAGSTGVGIPLAIGAAVVGMGAWLVDSLWGKTPQESLLSRVGVLK